jgi:hypothetical protein
MLGPATKPLSCTICNGSDSETLRVRLLSKPQAKQAPTMASGPSSPESVGVPVQDSTSPPFSWRVGDEPFRVIRMSYV